MSNVTYQTVRLSRGKHGTPDEGACVMELASMLAGEPFSDHPTAVCPVIGSFLRAYNDSIDGGRRQDLYEYAARVVGSRGSQRVQDARSERLTSWISDLRTRGRPRSRVARILHALAPKPTLDSIGASAVHAVIAHRGDLHAEVLALVDELLALGGLEKLYAPAAVPAPDRVDAPGSVLSPAR